MQETAETTIQLAPHEEDISLVLETAARAGRLLLENGAEIRRVEETMQRIGRHYGVTDEEFFVLSNGIFTTGSDKRHRLYANVRHIPVRGTRMDIITAINALSRDVESADPSLEELNARLDAIEAMPPKPAWARILFSGIGSAAFCILFGGSLYDSLVAFIAGLILYVFVVFLSEKHLTKITGNLIGGALVTVTCILLARLGLGNSMSHMIIGAIIPLIPGVAMTYGVRDIASGDYISGIVRLLDAALVFLCIAIGVGTVFTVYAALLGGTLS